MGTHYQYAVKPQMGYTIYLRHYKGQFQLITIYSKSIETVTLKVIAIYLKYFKHGQEQTFVRFVAEISTSGKSVQRTLLSKVVKVVFPPKFAIMGALARKRVTTPTHLP